MYYCICAIMLNIYIHIYIYIYYEMFSDVPTVELQFGRSIDPLNVQANKRNQLKFEYPKVKKEAFQGKGQKRTRKKRKIC